MQPHLLHWPCSVFFELIASLIVEMERTAVTISAGTEAKSDAKIATASRQFHQLLLSGDFESAVKHAETVGIAQLDMSRNYMALSEGGSIWTDKMPGITELMGNPRNPLMNTANGRVGLYTSRVHAIMLAAGAPHHNPDCDPSMCV